jgi:opacity protein-like surface antigen
MTRISDERAAKSGRATRLLPAVVVALAATFSSSAVFAQAIGANCNVTGQFTAPGAATPPNGAAVAGALGQSSAALAGTIAAVETAFLSQQGSAFVSAPGNPVPNQPGGGVWIRGVGGEANISSSSNTTLTATAAPGAAPVPVGSVAGSTSLNCANQVHLTFGGVQIGTDIARLNWNGWNVHWGATAGYVGAKTNDTNQLFPFSNSFEVPFLGSYIVATKGRFFAHLMVREEMFNINLFNAGLAFSNQPVSAHGYSISADAGYNFDLKNGWFAEPSAGFIYSRTSVDPFTQPGSGANASNFLAGTIAINDIESEMGRLSLRVGKNIDGGKVLWQPFVSASVFHEFANNTSATSTFPAFCCAIGPVNALATNSTTRVGTYGQYSIGIAAQVVNTGWLGYVRGDYKDGDNINGWGASAGLRYQFTPEMIAAAMPVKVKAPRPYIAPTNWTGFYVGGVLGADYGRTDVTVLTAPAQKERPWVAGGLGGFEVGYNRQLSNRWVLGVEGDIVATNTHGSRNLPPVPGTAGPTVPTPNTIEVSDRTNWIGTVTGKVGYAYERTLYYVKGGVAFEDSRIAATCFDPVQSVAAGGTAACANGFTAFPGALFVPGLAANGASTWTTQTRVGWTAGFGTEFDLGKGWSAKSEVDILDFGRHTALSSNGVLSLSDWNYLWQGKIGVNYHFGAGPVIAKY